MSAATQPTLELHSLRRLWHCAAHHRPANLWASFCSVANKSFDLAYRSSAPRHRFCQPGCLSHGTVRENIACGKPEATLGEITAAAKVAEAHDFILQLPDGYDTIVGERGQKLSGGQRQRVSMARAVLKDPPVLILDEATSAVDNETEAAIQRSLERIAVGRTTIVIAHRLSTVRNADRIFV